MFNLFGRKTVKEFTEEARDTYGVPEVKPVSVPTPKSKEHYRVGYTDDGMTTITLIGDDGYSMTLSMNQDACEQLIRMLQSTFKEEKITEETE